MNQNLEDINYDKFKSEIELMNKFDKFEKYKNYKSLIAKYKDLILFIIKIENMAKCKFPKDKLSIKLNIIDSNICEYYLLDETSDFKINNKIYQDKNILTNLNKNEYPFYKYNFPGFELFLDNIKKIKKK